MYNIIERLRKVRYEYRRQLAHAAFGMLVFAFPFFDHLTLLLLNFLLLLVLWRLSKSPFIERTFYGKADPRCKEHTDMANGMKAAMNVTLSVFIMLLISQVLELTKMDFPLYVIGGAIAISTFGCSAASFIRHKNFLYKLYYRKGDEKEYLLPSSIVMLIVGIIAASVAGSWTSGWRETNVSMDMIFFLAVIGSITAALFESIPSKVDNNLIVPLGTGMTMWLFHSFGYSVPPYEMFITMVFSLILGYLAYRAKIADLSALFSAALLGVLIIVFADITWFILLLTFFILGGAFTKYKYKLKEELGLAQSKDGVRSYENVFSNSLMALILALLYGIYPQYAEIMTFAYLGTVATATGDTLASEIGSTARSQPIMITTLKPVHTGVDGAVSLLGEIAAIMGAMVIGILAVLFSVLPGSDNTSGACFVILITTLGGFLGTNVDSLLGATLQKRGLLSNSGVNLAATCAGGFISGALYFIFVHV